MGSNTVRIIKSVTKCPVLVVPENFEYKRPEKIAFALISTEAFSMEVIRPLTGLAARMDVPIHVVHINESDELDKYQQANKDILDEFLNPIKHQFHWMSYFASKSDVMQYFLDEYQMDMFTLINYKHGFWKS